jgi:hypothetical protein
MLLDSKAKIKWHGKNRNRYERLGYVYTKQGDEFEVNISELHSYCKIKLNFICDYCGKYFQQRYDTYVYGNEKGIVHKDCCNECRHLKCKESNLIKYGVDHTSRIPEIAKKLGDKSGKRRLPFKKIKEEFSRRGYILLSKEHEYENNETILSYLCRKHLNKGILYIAYNNLSRGRGCKHCYLDSHKGEGSHSWKGGITSIRMFLRGKIDEWKFNTLKKDNFRCVLTGSKKELEIHHLVGFSIIFDEVIKESNLPIYDHYTKYTESELEYLTKLFLEKHNNYGLGVCLRKDVHKLFHSIYGIKNNTPDQFEEFKRRFLNGEFNEHF